MKPRVAFITSAGHGAPKKELALHALSNLRTKPTFFGGSKLQQTRPSIFIAIPSYGGTITIDTMLSIFNLSGLLSARGVPHTINVTSESMVTSARNFLVSTFLATSATHLLFIECDVAFNPNDIMELIEAKRDVIGLPYSRKFINWQRVQTAVKSGVPVENIPYIVGGSLCMTPASESIDPKQPMQVLRIGMGTVLIAKRVFTQLSDAHPEWAYIDNTGHAAFTFFRVGIDKQTKRYLGEDYMFCDDWSDIGGDIFCLPSAVTVHIGRQQFVCNIPNMQALGVEMG